MRAVINHGHARLEWKLTSAGFHIVGLKHWDLGSDAEEQDTGYAIRFLAESALKEGCKRFEFDFRRMTMEQEAVREVTGLVRALRQAGYWAVCTLPPILATYEAEPAALPVSANIEKSRWKWLETTLGMLSSAEKVVLKMIVLFSLLTVGTNLLMLEGGHKGTREDRTGTQEHTTLNAPEARRTPTQAFSEDEARHCWDGMISGSCCIHTLPNAHCGLQSQCGGRLVRR